MIWLQRTLDREVTAEGMGLHSGEPARMTLAPAEPNTGIVFRVPGPEGEVVLPALVENALPAEDLVRATTLAADGVTSTRWSTSWPALAGLGVTNCRSAWRAANRRCRPAAAP